MIKIRKNIIYTSVLMLLSCESKYSTKEIRSLLLSKDNNATEIIKGAFLAGESGKKEYIPLLLVNANDVRMCSDVRFKGFTVYQEKMGAIEKILKIKSPVKITKKPDSTVIKFYMKLSENR